MSIKRPIEIKYIDEVFLTDFEEACFLYTLLPYINIAQDNGGLGYDSFKKTLLNLLLEMPLRGIPHRRPMLGLNQRLLLCQINELSNVEKVSEFTKKPEALEFKKNPHPICKGTFKSDPPDPKNDPIFFYYLRKIATNQSLHEAFTLLLSEKRTTEINKTLAELLTQSSHDEPDAQTLIQARILALMKKMLEHWEYQGGYTHVSQENQLYYDFYDMDRESPNHTLSYHFFAVFVCIVNMNMMMPILPFILAPYSPLPNLAIWGIIVAATLMFDFFVVPRVSTALDPDFDKKTLKYKVDWKFNHIKDHMDRVASDFDTSIIYAKNIDNIDTKKYEESRSYTKENARRRAGTRTFLSQYTVGAPTIIKNIDPKDKGYSDPINVTLIKKSVIS